MSASQRAQSPSIIPLSPTSPSPFPGDPEKRHGKHSSTGSQPQLPLPTSAIQSSLSPGSPSSITRPSTAQSNHSLHSMLPLSPSRATTPLLTGVPRANTGATSSLNSPTSAASPHSTFSSLQVRTAVPAMEETLGEQVSQAPSSPVASNSAPVFTGTHPLPITASNIQLLNHQFTSQQPLKIGANTTHAPGIQPSMGFFRPARPSGTSSPVGNGGFAGMYGGAYNPTSYAVSRLPPPPSLDEDHDGLTEDEDTNQAKRVGQTPHHRLSTSPMLNSSLSQHAHHHSNHSDEHIRVHEDGGIDFRRHSGDTGVKMKVSKEPLLDTTPKRGSLVGARLSVDGSTKQKRGSIMSATGQALHSYRPRLTFDSLRSINRESREVPLASEKNEYPLTSKQSWTQRNRESGFSSHSPSPAISIRTSTDTGAPVVVDGEMNESSHRSRFVPTPPQGEQSRSKTPLKHPLDPSLLPVSKLDEFPYSTLKRKRKSPFGAIPSPRRLFVTKPKDGSLVKRYELHPSRNHFFVGGRVMTGGDSPWAFIMTLCLIFGVGGAWFSTTGVWWWRYAGLTQLSQQESQLRTLRRIVDRNGIPYLVVNTAARHAGKALVIIYVYAACLVISSMMYTAFSDPGILPRNLDPDPPYPSTSPSDGGVRAPMPRDLKVRSDTVRVKYCPTCKTYRPPRASHCKMCDNCVDTCDHHCQWVNNCIGSRNYTMFFVLLFSATFTLIFTIVTAALQLYYATQWGGVISFAAGDGIIGETGLSLQEVLKTRSGTGSGVIFCVGVVVIWPVAALLTYHLRLLFLNTTTIEQIRNQAHKTLVPGPAPPNPFSHGNWRKNFIAMLCRPQPLSWLEGSAIATEDKREINPGMFAQPVSLPQSPVDLKPPENGVGHGLVWAGITIAPEMEEIADEKN